jgi:hypothetical protein
MARLILVLVAIGLVIFLVRALRRKPPGKEPDRKLPPPLDGEGRYEDRHEDHRPGRDQDRHGRGD